MKVEKYGSADSFTLDLECQLVSKCDVRWTEMAALCPGVQYGLSSQENLGENKDLIFVKLTDSALRAIEEYRKNQVSSHKSI